MWWIMFLCMYLPAINIFSIQSYFLLPQKSYFLNRCSLHEGWLQNILSSIFSATKHKPWGKLIIMLSLFSADPVDILHLPGVSSHLAAVVHDFQDWWGRDHHQPLLVCTGCLPCLVHRQLDLPLLFWGILWLYCHCSWMCPNSAILWLFLLVHYKRWWKVNMQLKYCLMDIEYDSKNSSCW